MRTRGLLEGSKLAHKSDPDKILTVCSVTSEKVLVMLATAKVPIPLSPAYLRAYFK